MQLLARFDPGATYQSRLVEAPFPLHMQQHPRQFVQQRHHDIAKRIDRKGEW